MFERKSFLLKHGQCGLFLHYKSQRSLKSFLIRKSTCFMSTCHMTLQDTQLDVFTLSCSATSVKGQKVSQTTISEIKFKTNWT